MRNIKMLGLLVVSAMALAAFMGTSLASAETAGKFTTGGPGENIVHSETANHVFEITGATVDCETTNFTGTTTGKEQTKQTVSPSYNGCEAFGFAEAEIHENGCELTFTATTTGVTGHADVHVEGCGTGTSADKTKGIQITVVVPFFATCIVDVPEQTVGTAVRYSETTKPINISVTASKVMADVTTSTGFCPLTTGTHSGENGGKYTGGSSVTTANGAEYHKE
jgi:hypothetical protein